MKELQLRVLDGLITPANPDARDYIKNLDNNIHRFKHYPAKEGRRQVLNRLSHAIYREAAKLYGDRTMEEEKAYCKLTYGIPVLGEDDDDARELYEKILSKFSYEEQIELMKDSSKIKVEVTSIMLDHQMSKYIDRMMQGYAEQGVYIVSPEDRRILEEISGG